VRRILNPSRLKLQARHCNPETLVKKCLDPISLTSILDPGHYTLNPKP